MVIVVPFDGTDLATTALLHAENASKLYADPVVALTAIPRGNVKYARDRRWLSADEPFDMETIVARLRGQVAEAVPESEFRHLSVPRYSSTGAISSQLRRFAKDLDASAVFIGSENAGRIVVGMGSVGGRVAADLEYDVAIIRQSLSEADFAS
ncbi:universal stress protein [Halolamina sediminis]|uniref:universal stress protein n=1 Tax=Halolamina sediminis TaxID=1480675 RepID=UPI0006B4A246|nr:universal stress protein [Halolamina sediminis]